MKNVKVLWVDDAVHMFFYSSLFELLNYANIEITKHILFDLPEFTQMCEGHDVVVIHCGTYNTMPNLRELLMQIKDKYPKIKRGLISACKHPLVEDLVDFYVDITADSDDLATLLRRMGKN